MNHPPASPTATSGAEVGLVICSEDGRLLAYNECLLRLAGVSPEERDAVAALGETREARDALERALTRRTAGVIHCGAPDARCPPSDERALPDGRLIQRYAAPVHGAGGAKTGRALFFRDATGARRGGDHLEGETPEASAQRAERSFAQLALADRLASSGTLAAGVAHEINNPLAYVTANLAFLAEGTVRLARILAGEAPTPEDADLAAQLQEAMREARRGAERMRVVVRDLKTFSRGEEDRQGAVDLRPIIDSCVNLAWSELCPRARLTRDLAPVPPVLGNEARLGQLFLNLVVNAAQAIPEGRPEENEVTLSTRTLVDGRIAVEVRDTGCGIPEALLPRIFDPFFTTRAPGTGTGLGLSVCHAIVSAMGASIEVETAVGKGSTFRVLLPPAAAQEDAAAPAPHAAPIGGRRGRILVVDDEPLVGTVLRRTLTEHDVTVVQSGHAALERLATGERFDVVLSDLLMPEMSGMDLYREIVRRDPAVARRVVFLTGGAFTPAARDFLERERVECVEKPFELEALRALVARRLALGS